VSTLFDLLQDGRKHRVSRADYEHFLDVLPPVCLDVAYQGERWDFGFAEGADYVLLFKRQGEHCYAIRTPYLNPYEVGDFEAQQHRWILQWIKLANRHPAIRRAAVPLLTTGSFYTCLTDAELLTEARHRRPREALCLGNLCFIKLSDDGNRWLAIKEGVVMAGVSFGDGPTDHPADGQKVIDDLRAFAIVERSRRTDRFAR
jgi:hypothetical protein